MTYFLRRASPFFFSFVIACLLGACTTAGPSAPIQTIKEITSTLWPGEPKALEVKKGPYQYLHAQLGKTMAVLVLGYIEKTPEGPIQVWYGADGLTLKLNDQGRIVGIWGLPVEWSNVQFFYPTPIAELYQAQTFTRMRDEMPGHHAAMKEAVTVKPIAEVPVVIRQEFKGPAVQWYEESALVKGYSRNATLYAYYGWIKKNSQTKSEWIYGYQCLAEDICLTWFKDPKEVFQ